MFLSLFPLGGDSVFATALPPKKQRKDFIVNGECDIDNIHTQNIELDNDEILSTSTEQTWGLNTIFLANFEDSLEAGNFTNLNLPITHWRIKRKKIGESVYKLISEVSSEYSTSTFIDILSNSGVEYEYAVYPVSNGTEGNPILGVGKVDFYGWILSDEDGFTSFTFDIELDTDSIRSVTDFQKIDNYTRYPVTSKGQRRYQEGNLTCMPLEIIDNEYKATLGNLEKLEDFINNSQPKILRNGKGQSWKVQTHNFSYKYMDKVSEQPYHISFSWVEIGESI